MSLVVVLANEVWNYPDIIKLKTLASRLLKVLGDRGHAIRLDNSVTSDREVRTIRTYKCDVSPMKSSNHWQPTFWLQRLARQDSADRMRDCVMDVKQIEIFCFGDCRHLRRERECVRLMFKKWVRHHLDFVETNAFA